LSWPIRWARSTAWFSVGDGPLVQLGRDALEVRGELAEQQHPVTIAQNLVEPVEECNELGTHDLAVLVLVDDRGIQGHHAQQGQGPEHDEAVAIQVLLDQAQDLLAFALQHRVVQRPVLLVQFDLPHLFLFGWQFLGD
jgi:hypothetical protein